MSFFLLTLQQEQIQRESATIEVLNGTDKTDQESNSQSATSDHSDHSDEPSSSSGSHDYPDSASQPSSWMSFAQSLFSLKGSSSYCCAPLQQPLLSKKEKSDHLVSFIYYIRSIFFLLQGNTLF